MTLSSRSLLYTFLAIALVLIAYSTGLHTRIAEAALTAFKTDCYTASATSTLRFMTPGNATTTVTCPMGSDGAQSAALAIQVNASSTAAVFNIYVEESMDGQDWYPIPDNQSATTTNPFGLGVRAFSSFKFASSTIGGVEGLLGASSTPLGASSNNRNHYLLDVPVRMKYVRAYAALTGANAGIWMQVLPKMGL